jgi:hypothetical protein
VVDGAALEKRCAKAPWVRIPPSPPHPSADGPRRRRRGRRGTIGQVRPDRRTTPAERSPRGLGRRTGNAVWGNPSRVRIPPSPPVDPVVAGRATDRVASGASRSPSTDGRRVRGSPGRPSVARFVVSFPSRARRGTSGALYLQSAPAGLNPHPRSPSSKAALASDVEGRVPRSGDSRTGSGPEGSSPKRCSSGAAVRPGPSRSGWWARGRSDRRWVHGVPASLPARPHRDRSSADP